VTAAGVSAGTDVLRHCDPNDFSRRTAVESTSNRSCTAMDVQSPESFLLQGACLQGPCTPLGAPPTDPFIGSACCPPHFFRPGDAPAWYCTVR